MVLVTGPRAAEKPHLYSALILSIRSKQFMTAEDPLSSTYGHQPVQMKEHIGLNFAAALVFCVRLPTSSWSVNPRLETAEIAIKAALTVICSSTLHTNDAPSTISRLMNMGIEPFLVATSVNLIQAQRLIRRVCKDCKQKHSNAPGSTHGSGLLR